MQSIFKPHNQIRKIQNFYKELSWLFDLVWLSVYENIIITSDFSRAIEIIILINLFINITKIRSLLKLGTTIFLNIAKTFATKPSKKLDIDEINLLTSRFDVHAVIKKVNVCYPKLVSDTFKFTLVSMQDVKKK